MKKEQLEARVQELEGKLSNAWECYNVEHAKSEAFAKENKDLLEKVTSQDKVFKALGEALLPYLAKALLEDGAFTKGIEDIAYNAAGVWGDDNWVQCGHDPLEE